MNGAAAPQGALFDLDGVLIDTEAAILELWRRLADGRAAALSERELRMHVLGCAPEHTVNALFARAPVSSRCAILAEVRRAEKFLAFETMPRARALLRELAAAGVPLGLVTSASAERVARAVDGLAAYGLFGATVTWDDRCRGKPDPEPYLLAAARLGVAPRRCVVFEDAPSGVHAAVAAGACCIGIGAGAAARELHASGAAMVVSGLDKITVGGAPSTNERQLVVAGVVLRLDPLPEDRPEERP